MLFRDKPIFNQVVTVFSYKGFSFYSIKGKADKSVGSAFTASFKADPSKERLAFSLKGAVTANGQALEEKDMAYVPVNSALDLVVPDGSVAYVAEAAGTKAYPAYVKRFKEVKPLTVGLRNYTRLVRTMLGEGDPANSFLAGYTDELPGEWSSYPPHRHEGKPEAYVFYGVNPGFAVQVSMTEEGETAYVVRDFDVFLVTGGYHPHASSPLTGSGYAWVIAAPEGERKLEVEVHPDFKGEDFGKSHLTVKRSKGDGRFPFSFSGEEQGENGREGLALVFYRC